MTMSAKEWIDLAFGQSGEARPRAPVLPPCDRLLDPAMPSDEREALENSIWQSLDAQFPWLMTVGQNPAAHSDKIGEFARVIRWLELSIADWGEAATNLAELVITMARLNNRNELVETLPPAFVSNAAFVQALSDIIRHAPPAKNLFLWPNRGNAMPLLERLEVAWQQGLWSEVARCYDSTDYLLPTTLVTTSVRILARWSPSTLKALGDEVQDLLSAHAISFALERRDALQLAATTSSETMRFACAYTKLHACRTALTIEETAILSDVFVVVSGDTRVWRGWMEVFNRYPARFPQIQPSLGAALSRMPAKALFAYVDALELHTRPNDERGLAAECLSHFARKAGKRKRAAVWKHAHRRWQTWDFDRHVPDRIVTDISWSALDYALTGFFLECFTDDERNTLATALRATLASVDATWHDSLTACATQWYRVQSQIQPVVHALKVATTGCDWLAEKLYVVGPIDDPSLYFDRKHLIMTRR